MKKILISVAVLFCTALLTFGQTNLSLVNTGTANNDKTGDTLRVAFGKINSNCMYLTNLVGLNRSNELVSITATNAANLVVTTNLFKSVTNAGVTTNLQFTFTTAAGVVNRTNTLYFTNGILMRVSQP